MEKLQEILKRLFRWIGFLLLIIIVIRIISVLIPSANPDNYLGKVKDELNQESTTTKKGWFSFPDPGSWGTFSNEPVKVQYLEAKFDGSNSTSYTPGPSADYNTYKQNQSTSSAAVQKSYDEYNAATRRQNR